MAKVNITANQMLLFIKTIFNDQDIDLDDLADEFGSQSITDALNVEYYTFKKRPESTEQLLQAVARDGGVVDELLAARRAFCCLTMNDLSRVFSVDTDQVTVQGTLDFWIQTAKINLLEYLITKCNTELSGLRIPVTFPGNENRFMTLSFGTLNTSAIEQTQIGESVQAAVNFEATFFPETQYKSTYKIAVGVDVAQDNQTVFADLPIVSFNYNSIMEQDNRPNANDDSKTKLGAKNLRNAKTFEIVCDAFTNNAALNFLKGISMATPETPAGYANTNADIDTVIPLRVTEGTDVYLFNCVLQQHGLVVVDDNDNAVHTFVLTLAAVKDSKLEIKVNDAWVELPTLSFAFTTQMTPQIIPMDSDPEHAGAFNVYGAMQWQITCNNLRSNAGLHLIMAVAMLKQNVNTTIKIRVTYNGEQTEYDTVLYMAQVQLLETTGADGCVIVLSQKKEPDEQVAIQIENEFVDLPCLACETTSTMNQKGIPFADQPHQTQTVNLGNSKIFAVSCNDLQGNAALNFLIDIGLQSDTSITGVTPRPNNQMFIMRLTRNGGRQYFYRCVLSQYVSKIRKDTGQPTHQFTITQGGA